MPNVNPEILQWARETAGLSVPDSAKKLHIKPERLDQLESGAIAPTRRQLANMASVYRRPLITFYLRKAPERAEIGHDFRTISLERKHESQPLLDSLIRDIYTKQGLVRSALEEMDEDVKLSFVGSVKKHPSAEEMASIIINKIEFSPKHFRSRKTISEAFEYLREQVERIGVFVLLIGNLGSHHTDIESDVFRGFALADPVAPFVVINQKDSRSSWSFTLLHELTHIWLGQTGVSGYEGDQEVEQFCDLVASRILLHPRELSSLPRLADVGLEGIKQAIDEFSREAKVSRKMLAYNLYKEKYIGILPYRRLSQLFKEEWDAEKKRRSKDDGGPNYYVVRRHRLGKSLVGTVGRMINNGALTTTKAGLVLGVKPGSVYKLINNNAA